MEMKNEIANEREYFNREKDKWMQQIKKMQHKYESDKQDFQRQKYVLTVSKF